MPLHLGALTLGDEYVLYYQKKEDTILVSAPTKDDAKELFTWLKGQVFP